MALNAPLPDLNIKMEASGFYQGFSKLVTIGSKVSIGALILWAVVQPETAGEILKNNRITIDFKTPALGICMSWRSALLCVWQWRFGLLQGAFASGVKTAILSLQVLYDVWGWDRYWNADLCHRRANLSLCQ